MKTSLKKLLFLVILFMPITFLTFNVYASSSGNDEAIIDTETCINCGDCWNNQSMWVFENSGNGYATWRNLYGTSLGLHFYYNPSSYHKEVIEIAAAACPTTSIIFTWTPII